MEKKSNLLTKVLNKEVILYTVFGLLTTVVNFIVFYILIRLFAIEENTSNVIALIIAILFAYVTNSIWVFNSTLNLKEFFKFMLGRSFTMFVEIAGFFVMFNLLNIPDLISKIFLTILVIVLNYFISKYFSFHK